MKRKYAKLQRIDNNEEITEVTRHAFYEHLQMALLLALRERGRLNAAQYFRAEEMLRQRHLKQARRNLEQR